MPKGKREIAKLTPYARGVLEKKYLEAVRLAQRQGTLGSLTKVAPEVAIKGSRLLAQIARREAEKANISLAEAKRRLKYKTWY